MQISMKTNISKFTKAIDLIGKSQIPFATSRALNETAKDVREQILTGTYPRSFTVRNKQFAKRMFKVDRSTKRKLVARVYDSLGRDYMAMQESGGTKKPKGNNLAIPTDQIKRGARGIPKGRRPRALINPGNKSFRQTLPNGQDVILQRRTKKRYPLKVLYLFEPSVKIKPTFPFYEDGRKVAQKMFNINFKKHFKLAKMTAK